MLTLSRSWPGLARGPSAHGLDPWASTRRRPSGCSWMPGPRPGTNEFRTSPTVLLPSQPVVYRLRQVELAVRLDQESTDRVDAVRGPAGKARGQDHLQLRPFSPGPERQLQPAERAAQHDIAKQEIKALGLE